MDGYIAKPIKSAELVAVIEQVMASCNSAPHAV
jgi:DNA-binding response OmpR family regulator